MKNHLLNIRDEVFTLILEDSGKVNMHPCIIAKLHDDYVTVLDLEDKLEKDVLRTNIITLKLVKALEQRD